MKKPLNKLALILIPALLIPLAACAGNHEKPTPKEGVKYSVDFNTDGTITVRDVNGRIAEPIPLDLPNKPLPVKAIENFHTLIEAQGSCLVLWNGAYYRIC